MITTTIVTRKHNCEDEFFEIVCSYIINFMESSESVHDEIIDEKDKKLRKRSEIATTR